MFPLARQNKSPGLHPLSMSAIKQVLFLVFLRHPRSVGMTYIQHFGVAMRASCQALLASWQFAVHAIVPALFTTSGSDRIVRVMNDLQNSRFHDRVIR